MKRINSPFLYGYQIAGPNGIIIEIVRCDIDEWTVFLTYNGDVVACPLPRKDAYMPFFTAFKLACTLV